MRTDLLVQRLQELQREAANPSYMLATSENHAEVWRNKLRATLVKSVGFNNYVVREFDSLRFRPSVTDHQIHDSLSPEEVSELVFYKAVTSAVGYAEVVIYEIQELSAADELFDDKSFDPQLWKHVETLVEDEDWNKVASQTAIFTEDQVRKWSKLGSGLVGKGLYGKALADDGPLRLGSQKGEWEGWRSLAIGFAQATSNVDRHHISDRNDARRYAIGVLGAASLLLTQMRFQHRETAGSSEDS